MSAADEVGKADQDKTGVRRTGPLLCWQRCAIATRTGNGELTRAACGVLLAWLPDETAGLFRLALHKSRARQYPSACRDITQAHYRKYADGKRPASRAGLQ